MAKYKFALTSAIKGFVEWQLEHYHEDKKQLEQYRRDMMPQITPSYSLASGIQNGSTSDPTAKAGIKMATSQYIRSMEQSIEAVDRVLARCDDSDRQLIELVYWRRSHTITGAGMIAGLSQKAAYNRINKLLTLTAAEMGLIGF